MRGAPGPIGTALIDRLTAAMANVGLAREMAGPGPARDLLQQALGLIEDAARVLADPAPGVHAATANRGEPRPKR